MALLIKHDVSIVPILDLKDVENHRVGCEALDKSAPSLVGGFE
jgi:hypothetical protein